MQPARENFREIPVLLLSCSYYIKKKATRKPGSFQIFIYVNYRISKDDTTPGPLSFRIKVIIKTEAVISCSVIHNDTNIEKFSETDYFFSKKIALDSHDILFLSCDKSVDFLNVLIGNFLDFLFTLFLSVLRKAFVLLSLLGAAIAAKRGAHLGFTLLSEHVGAKVGRILGIISMAAATVFSGIICYFGVFMALNQFNKGQVTGAMQLPEWIFGSFVPLGALLVTIRFAQNLIKLILGKDVEHEDVVADAIEAAEEAGQ